MLFYFLIFVLAFAVLAYSSESLVSALISLARFFKISEYVVAFIFMGLVTSLPELFIGITSAVSGMPQFSLGNVLGSNLIKVSLMIGLIVLFGGGLRIDSKISKRNFWIISGLAFLPILLAADGVLSRGDGIVLLLAFVFYLVRLSREKEYFSKTINHGHGIGSVFAHFSRSFWGVILLIVSSYVIVWSGKHLAEAINLSLLTFGLLFVAVGTSLPEMTFGIRAKMLKHGSMALGNALGNVAFNSMLILGVVSAIHPIAVSFSTNIILIVAFSVAAFLCFNVFVFSRSFVSRKEGFVLFLLYAAFFLCEFFVAF